MGIQQGAADAVLALANGGLGHAHHGEGGQSVGEVHLDAHKGRVEALVGPR